MRPDAQQRQSPQANGAGHPPFKVGVFVTCVGLEVGMLLGQAIRLGGMGNGREKPRKCARRSMNLFALTGNCRNWSTDQVLLRKQGKKVVRAKCLVGCSEPKADASQKVLVTKADDGILFVMGVAAPQMEHPRCASMVRRTIRRCLSSAVLQYARQAVQWHWLGQALPEASQAPQSPLAPRPKAQCASLCS